MSLFLKVILFFVLIVNCSLFILNSAALAVVDPLSVPNNRIGVHILQPDEVFQAGKLVNSSGGSWGYVTIPIRSDDRDRTKWINFFLNCRQTKVIPIIRIATYVDNENWVAPTVFDLIDFANFLNDMPWPVKNRYVVIYNEPNHSKEWGGLISPSEYASILIQAKDIFKSRSEDFFILNGALDMSAPTNKTSLDALQYYRQMTKSAPGWYGALDGFSVHAYPNPGFISSPLSSGRFGITSYRYEINLLSKLGYKNKPLFITETGYLGSADFYKIALDDVWQDKNIVAITPFVLFAGAGDFMNFSLMDPSNQPKPAYNSIFNIPKTGGAPLLNAVSSPVPDLVSYSSDSNSSQSDSGFFQKLKNFVFPPSPRLTIGDNSVEIEIASTPAARERGLSYRKNLLPGSGMLFVFPESLTETFWMKDMNFPLDFIWINDNQVVNLTENVPNPRSKTENPAIIMSGVPVDRVLEVNAGFIKNHSVRLGDRVVLNSP